MQSENNPQAGSPEPPTQVQGTLPPPRWNIVYRKAKELIPNERNPRKITEEKFQKLQEMIRTQGFRRAPNIDTKGVLLCGHQSVRALILIGGGDIEIPCMVPDRELTEAEARFIMTSDNLSRGEWDYDILASDNDLDDLIDMGFDEKELAFLNEDEPEIEDEADEEPGGGGAMKCPACGHEF